ncbi:MAG: hypothetical protein WC249_00460 [Patescibacteria group bacterium]|jgi:hypothetical protein
MSEDGLKDFDRSLRAIISVVAFFDMFEYPLTAYEIWENLDKSIELEKIYKILEPVTNNFIFSDGQNNNAYRLIIQQKNGFYFLNGRAEIVVTRQKRYNYFCRKVKIARRFTYLFSFFPFVRVVALANIIGAYNLHDGSDIDFFIITEPRRIWLSRLYCTGLAKILNSRPNIRTKKDKICLSFYLTQDYSNLTNLRLSGEDPYFDYWRRGLVLLYNKNKSYEHFLNNNSAAIDLKTIYPVVKKNCLDWLERQAKAWQLKIMPPILKAAINNSAGVVVNDQVLKFYQHDRRREYAQKYGNKIHEIFKENY